MDGNKDEALKCLRIGRAALDSGDRRRALKFLAKARRLDPTLQIDHLLSSASQDAEPDAHAAKEPDDSSFSSSNPPPPPSSRSSAAATTRARANSASDGPGGVVTDEQIAIVRQIKKEKDYYKILGLERVCALEDVRKAYRKLSLKVHPDKNNAPGADEAFKAVSKAFQCLSNEESRKRYDLVGSEEPDSGRPAARHHRGDVGGFTGFYEADIDPEEIFRQFFFGGMAPAAATPFGTFRYRTGGMGVPSASGMHGSGNFNIRGLLQLLPIILFLLLNFLPSSEPVYSFSRNHPYEHKIETSRGASYYVNAAKFEQDYPNHSSQRIALEQSIDREYYGILAQNCRLEMQRRRWGISYQTPHCDMLQKFQETA